MTRLFDAVQQIFSCGFTADGNTIYFTVSNWGQVLNGMTGCFASQVTTWWIVKLD
jgi:hypothetical protein